mmetsp:Transcript_77738/g.207680  ORF Transcript_77738/g.207680 Transcript_77738/m.207680 type:complete len:265 (-) Transcript_77738:369-1163(-)
MYIPSEQKRQRNRTCRTTNPTGRVSDSSNSEVIAEVTRAGTTLPAVAPCILHLATRTAEPSLAGLPCINATVRLVTNEPSPRTHTSYAPARASSAVARATRAKSRRAGPGGAVSESSEARPTASATASALWGAGGQWAVAAWICLLVLWLEARTETSEAARHTPMIAYKTWFNCSRSAAENRKLCRESSTSVDTTQLSTTEASTSASSPTTAVTVEATAPSLQTSSSGGLCPSRFQSPSLSHSGQLPGLLGTSFSSAGSTNSLP